MFVSQAPWHNDIVFEFIELYRGEPMLWDPKHRDYKNKVALNSAWERLRSAISIECTVSELKKKKESLMTAYRLHIRRKRINPEYQTSWFAFEVMNSFLCEVYDNGEYSFPDKEFINTDEHLHILEKTRPIKRERQPSEAVSSEPVTYSYTQIPETMDRNEIDECDLYGQLLARKMRRLDERQRDIAMHDIDNIMFRAKMNSTSSQQHVSSKPKMKKSKTRESPIFIVTNDQETYDEEYLEDPMHET